MGKIKVAIIGVGNCASSFVQGIHEYVESNVDAFLTNTWEPTKREDMSTEELLVIAGKCKGCPADLEIRVAIAAWQAS